ncbi:protein kinase [Nonomuraea sp. NPDC048826]|uniref:protein kinase domain-containing protein n=1 Tax=Nonomuraea sp. NPDC048826 TaxID=3364347 RepID=UPI003715B4A7
MPDVRLRTTFRYIHEPLPADEDVFPMLGNQAFVDELKQRLRKSEGGTFLVTGFRGVGKSTVVARALHAIEKDAEPGEIVVPITVNVARPISPERLLFAVVRRTYEELADRGLLSRMTPAVQRALMLAHIRTSYGLKQTSSDATENAANLTLGMGEAAKKMAGPLAFVAPGLGLSRKRTRSMATEASFLTYSDTDVEHDLHRIVSLIGIPATRRWWRRRPGSRVHLVIVLDEADKLTGTPEGLRAFELMLNTLKNALTMRGVHFLIVAGPDLHDHAIRDVSRGNSVYESVFAWRIYVPCMWEAPERLLAALLSDTPDEAELRRLTCYLRFKARGVPRRLLQEFSELVGWEGDQPYLRMTATDRERVAVYAAMEDVLHEYHQASGRERLLAVPLDKDRWRMAGYYVLDWVLRTDGEVFSIEDILRAGELDPLLHVAHTELEQLLGHLVKRQVIQIVRQAGAESTLIGNTPAAQLTSYTLADDLRRRLLGLALHSESERAALDVSLLLPSAEDEAPVRSVIRVIGGRYDLVEVIGQGGMSSVYKAWSRTDQTFVAVKLIRTDVGGEGMRWRFEREIELARRLDHPGIVRTLDVVRDEQELALVMELVAGPTLQEQVAERGPLPQAEVTALGVRLAEALSYMHTLGAFRLDLKPSNIILADAGPKIVDVGIAKTAHDSETTSPHLLVGTPSYMSPEGATGVKQDIRSDIYALGLVLGFAATGRALAGSGNVTDVLLRIVQGRLDLDGLEPPLLDVVARATRHDRAERFQHPDELRAALLGQAFPPSPGGARTQAGRTAFMIDGVHCPNGHFTDGARPACMVCAAELGPDPVRHWMARPVLGTLVLDDGRELPLDGDYLIGSAPKTRAGTRTVKLAGIDEHHLSIRLDGWRVLARDLDTTGGTALANTEHGTFHQLPPGATVGLHPGMVLQLGRRATIRYRGRQS